MSPTDNGAWPAMSIDSARAALTAAGAPFEIEKTVIGGIPTRVWKNVPPTIAALLDQTRRHGDRPLLICDDDRISYDGNFRATATLARWLVVQGVAKGDRVALAMRNLPEWPPIFFAATAIGAIIVPLNAWWTGRELADALDDSGASILFCDAERYERIAPHLSDLPVIRQVVVTRGDRSAHALDAIIGVPGDYATLPDVALPQVALMPDDDAMIFYTSGTSGRPKGVIGTHRNMLTNIGSTAYAAARNYLRRGEPLPTPEPRVRLNPVPLFHVTGCASLLTGMPGGNSNIFIRKWDAGAALAIIERERVNITGGVPTIAWTLLDHPDRDRHDLSSLEAVTYGGGPSAPELVRRIASELDAVPGNGWGMTETTGLVTAHSGEDYLMRPDSCGPPVAVADLRIVAADGIAACPIGAVGELWVSGPMVARGYWQRPEESAATFVDGWVRTGDLARIDEESFCTIVDRAKDVIIRGGENIYATEVENILYAHPAVIDAALIGLPHRTLGEEPVAVVQCANDEPATEADLQAWVRAHLAAFKAPVRILFHETSLPRNASGKILKAALRDLFVSDAAPQHTVSQEN